MVHQPSICDLVHLAAKVQHTTRLKLCAHRAAHTLLIWICTVRSTTQRLDLNLGTAERQCFKSLKEMPSNRAWRYFQVLELEATYSWVTALAATDFRVTTLEATDFRVTTLEATLLGNSTWSHRHQGDSTWSHTPGSQHLKPHTPG